MSTKNILLPAAIALAFGAGNANAFLIDFDGPGGVAAPQDVSGIDPQPGNLLTRCFSGCTNVANADTDDILETFGHAAIGRANFSDAGGQNVTFGGSGGEWTIVFGFAEILTSTGIASATLFTVDVPGAANFFEVYFDSVANSNMLGGTGFNDGTLILSGTIDEFDPAEPDIGRADFTVTNLGAVLDQFADNNYPGKTTVSTSGNVQLNLSPTFQNTDFFIDPIAGLTFAATSQINLPFRATNPSGCFTQTPGGGAPDQPGAGASSGSGAQPGCGDSIGAVNGVTGPNIIFQSDANIALQESVVPEPTTLALLGSTLLAAGAARRLRKKA